MKLGFIGIGVMGSAIVNNLLKADYEVNIFTRTKSKAEEVINNGAVYFNTPKEVTENSDIIFTMVGYPSDVEEVYLGDKGIIEGINSSKILVDLTTSTPTLAKELFNKFKQLDCSVLDAPVSGGDKGAINGTMTIMVGGEQPTFDKVKPIFEIMGSTVVLQGPAGSGQHTKMCNQIALAGSMLGAVELIVYARSVGLDPKRVLQSVSVGSAASTAMELYTSRIFDEDYEPGFYVKHYVKDLKIAVDECRKNNINLPGLNTALMLYEKLEDMGYADLGNQALIKVYENDK